MHKYKLLFVSLFLINQAIAAETEIAASLDGNVNVSNLGVLDYSIPIDVPPSLNGFTPKLSLDYSGQSSDGVLGVGWSINGLSAISRCQSSEKNIALNILALTENLYTQQGKQGFSNSEFCLDGKKLILINPESMSSGQVEFHVENDEFSKITVQLSSSAASSEKAAINKFIVTNKNGTVQEYGKILKINTKNASGQYVDDQYLGVPLSYLWGLTSKKDINGNYWNIEYLEDKKTDGLYPKSIKYTGNVNGVAPLNAIDFEYSDRNEFEKKVGYNEGSTIVLDKKLSKINLKVNNLIKEEYRFNYEDINETQANKVRLKSIDYCSVNGTDKACVVPTQLQWSSYGQDKLYSPFSTGTTAINELPTTGNAQTVRFSDIKNSRAQNLKVLHIKGNDLKIYANSYNNEEVITLNHSLFSTFKDWLPFVMDINGDEIADLVIYGKDSSNNVSLLEYTSSFDTAGKRQFNFYKALNNIINTPLPLVDYSIRDTNKDGIADIEFKFIDENAIRFDTVELDGQGNKTNIKNVFVNSAAINTLKSKIGPNFRDNLIQGRFRNSEISPATKFYFTDSSGFQLCSLDSSSNNTNCSNSILIPGAEGLNYKDYEVSVVDYNKDGLDDIVLSKVERLDATNSTNTRFKEKILPLLAKGNNTYDQQPLIETSPYTIDTTGWSSTTWLKNFSRPIFSDFNQDGYVDLYRYTTVDEPNLIGHLLRYNKTYETFNYPLKGWSEPKGSTQEILWAILGLPSKISSKDYTLSYISEPNLDINLDGYQDAAFSILARSKSTTKAYTFSFASRTTKKNNDILITLEQLSNAPNPEFQDLLSSVDKGDGTKVKVSYKNQVQLPETVEKKPFPIRSTDAPILVVDNITSSLNGATISKNSYNFIAPRVDVKQNKYLGFERKNVKSESYLKNLSGNNLTQTAESDTIFNQSTDFIGMPKSVVNKVNGNLVSKLTVADSDFISDSAYAGTKVKFPRIKTTTTENYDLGKLISRTVNTNIYETIFGNLLESTAQTTSADGNVTFATKVNANYTAHDRSNWKPGLVTDRTVTATRTGEPAIVKKDAFEYDDKQRIKRTITEPDDLALKVQTDFQYDAYGNPTKVTVSGTGNAADTGIGSRSVTTAYEAGNGYPAGVFKTKQSNDLGQQSNFAYDAVTGQLLSSTDINGVVSTQSIDGLGRVISSQPAGGAKTDVSYELCKTFVSVGSNSRACETGENYKITTTSVLNASVISYKDAIGNVRRTITKAYDNVNDVIVRNEYNENGSLYRSSEPALSNVGYGSLQWTTFEYDTLGRVVKAVAPGNRVTSYTRNGLETIITNAKGQNRIERSNIANETTEIVNHDGHSLKYKRDALGRLTQTTDALGRNIVLTLDKNGNKLQQIDPNLGTWNYRYNVLGQPVWQQDGKGQQTSFQYDVLGRLIKRTEPDLVSSWVWDTSANGKGQIAQVSSTNGFVQSFAYDNFGRPYQSTTSKNIDPKAQGVGDSDFINKWNYDAAGRVLAYAYPTGFGYRNIYDTNGYLKEVRNLAGSQLYWAANARDARGNVTQETLGNGLTTNRTYQPDTGLIESINTGNASIQQNSYAFDALGNLINRNQNLAGISNNEAFTYDNINRLKTVVNQQGQTTSVNYDAIGNITQKTSNLDYKPVKEQTYSWNSFNMPISIQQGSDSESFIYDANHQRVRRTSIEDGKTTTTVYINPRIDTGGTFEKTYLPNGTTEYTHYIYAGGDTIGSYISNDKGVAPTGDLGSAYNTGVLPNSALAAIDKTGPYRYFHMDHLNSIEVITDAAGNPIERLSYDPWGKRRNVNGSESDIEIEGTKSSRGYTSHEMLDNIALVHMNGRVYDPQIGRFISADPNIDGADDLQGYNRYAYVRNNPGTLWDPSGYGFFGKVLGFVGLGSAGNAIDKAFSDVGNGILSVMDKWNLCDLSKGNCGFQAGIVNGPNNQSIGGAQNGQQTIQPFIGINGNNNYRINFSYENNQFAFNSFAYNGILINAKYFTQVTNYFMSLDTSKMSSGKDYTEIGLEAERAEKEKFGDFVVDQGLDLLEAWDLATQIYPIPFLRQTGQFAGFSAKGLRAFGCCCYVEGTLINTQFGLQPIESIEVGTLVPTKNLETGLIELKPVSKTYLTEGKEIYRLTTEDKNKNLEVVEVTDNHPYWVIGSGWVDSAQLLPEMNLTNKENETVKVISVVPLGQTQNTYNLEVEDNHNYFVGKQNILVHNCNCNLVGKNWSFNPAKDVDWRGSGKSYLDGLEEAFSRTGVPRNEFKITKWGKTAEGKSIPVQWDGPNGASVNLDIPQFNNMKNGVIGNGPASPHIGYQNAGKNSSRIRGHIFLDNIPATRR
ncbi:polymorphic toxin type 47 domain-containing protein [Acinetobacter bereziniae]|uniref:polymorphic toxin type 47 domain-containing protein n=1 Tax=Acinetobacter bereziniae TaxID=106648 RepID=UPI00125031CC|nr:polymorphic toxin type 47 domain-containing protein [Acinetobacter bereziniae]